MKAHIIIIAALAIGVAAPQVAHANEAQLENRLTLLPAFGMVWMQVHGESGSGMAIQPTVTRTYDRLEVQGELTLCDWADTTGTPHGALFERIAAAARYQAGRIRVERSMTLDLVVDASIGFQQIERDEGGAYRRPDFGAGLGLRMISDLRGGGTTGATRIFLGMEMQARLLVMPAPHGPDIGVILLFGTPVGR